MKDKRQWRGDDGMRIGSGRDEREACAYGRDNRVLLSSLRAAQG